MVLWEVPWVPSYCVWCAVPVGRAKQRQSLHQRDSSGTRQYNQLYEGTSRRPSSRVASRPTANQPLPSPGPPRGVKPWPRPAPSSSDPASPEPVLGSGSGCSPQRLRSDSLLPVMGDEGEASEGNGAICLLPFARTRENDLCCRKPQSSFPIISSHHISPHALPVSCWPALEIAPSLLPLIRGSLAPAERLFATRPSTALKRTCLRPSVSKHPATAGQVAARCGRGRRIAHKVGRSCRLRY